MEFEAEYALLRAARERAWTIEKQLSIAATGYEREHVDWRTFDIPRDVAARIAALSSKLHKDPSTLDIPHRKTPPRKIIKPTKTIPLVVKKVEPPSVVLPKRIVHPANEARATALRKEIRDAQKQKENDRQKANQSIPVKKSVRRALEPQKVKPTHPMSKIAKVPMATIKPIVSNAPTMPTSDEAVAILHKAPPVLTKEITQVEEHLDATNLIPTSENKESLSQAPQFTPAAQMEAIKVAEKTVDVESTDVSMEEINPRKEAPKEDLRTSKAEVKEVLMSVERKKKPWQLSKTPIVSGIGKQILSENRTMPSASFGFVHETSYGNAKNAPSISLLRRLFHDLDANSDGYLDKLQVSVALHRLRIHVDPQRISRFFEQAAQLNNSSLLLIDFRQFYAFVMAAIDHPDAHNRSAPRRKLQSEMKPIAVPQMEPAVFQEEDEPLYMEQTVSDYIVNRVLASVQEEVAPDIVASFDSEVLRNITRQLLVEQCQSSDNDELKAIGLDAEPGRLEEPLNVELLEVDEPKEDQVVAMIKALIQGALLESQPPTPPKEQPREQLKPQEKVVVDMATDTTDLLPMEEQAVSCEDKEIQAVEEVVAIPEPSLTLDDLPGKTLLGKLLHTTPDQRSKVGIRRVAESSSLLESLRALRTQRLKSSLSIEKVDTATQSPVISQLEAAMVTKLDVYEEPPPPAPPMSPRYQPEALSKPSLTASDGLKNYTLPTFRPMPANLDSLSRSSIVSSESSVASSKMDGLLSEGEIAEPNTLSDGELTGNTSRHVFYHTQKTKYQRKRQKAEISPSSSMESGELLSQQHVFLHESSSESDEEASEDAKSISSCSDSSFTGSVRAMSTGSVESGQIS